MYLVYGNTYTDYPERGGNFGVLVVHTSANYVYQTLYGAYTGTDEIAVNYRLVKTNDGYISDWCEAVTSKNVLNVLSSDADGARESLDAFPRAARYIAGAEEIDIDTAQFDFIMLVLDKTGSLSEIINGTFVYISQFYYNQYSANGQRIQIAHGYTSNDMATRYYYNGTWSDWKSIMTSDNIQASTTDLTAGTSTLANGNVYLVYE